MKGAVVWNLNSVCLFSLKCSYSPVKMSPFILLQLLFGLFGTNKSARQIIFLDCKRLSGLKTKIFLFFPPSIASISEYASFQKLSSERSFALSLVQLNLIQNISKAVDLILSISRHEQHFDVVLNYDCGAARETLEEVHKKVFLKMFIGRSVYL